MQFAIIVVNVNKLFATQIFNRKKAMKIRSADVGRRGEGGGNAKDAQ